MKNLFILTLLISGTSFAAERQPMEKFQISVKDCITRGSAVVCRTLNPNLESTMVCRGVVSTTAADGTTSETQIVESIPPNRYVHTPLVIDQKVHSPLVAAQADLECFYRKSSVE